MARLTKARRAANARKGWARKRALFAKRSEAAKRGWVTRRQRIAERKAAFPPPREILSREGIKHARGHTISWYGYEWSGIENFDDLRIHYEQLGDPGDIFSWYLTLAAFDITSGAEFLSPWSTPFDSSLNDVTLEAKSFVNAVIEGHLERYKMVTGFYDIFLGVGRKTKRA